MKPQASKTHCPQGHPYAGTNLILTKRGWRKCRQCGLDAAARRWQRAHPDPQKKGPVRVAEPKARRVVYKPQHPLRDRNGYVAESRMYLYDHIGPGIHPCHWCGTPLQWTSGKRLGRGLPIDALVVDHIDWNPHNNASDNLVPSCLSCNQLRTHVRVNDEEHFVTRKNGTRTRAEQRICEVCETVFLIPPAAATRGRGRTCSRSCARRLPRVPPFAMRIG